MISNDIDKFRNTFFDKLLQEEKEKEKQIQDEQEKCFHLYNIVDSTLPNGYQKRTCSKCNHSDIKSRKVWQGTKGCMIQ